MTTSSAEDRAVLLDDLRFRYPGGPPMCFDATIPGGSVTAVMGPSGSGKSTLFALIAGFEMPMSGRIAVGGRDITALPPAERPLSIVFQEHNLFAHLDVATNVALGLDRRGRIEAAQRPAIGAALERVGLAGFEGRMPASLSGGERQRVALARALVRNRPVLLLDEPFAALGPGMRSDMLELVKQLVHDTGQTTLFITHQPDEARMIADSVLFLDGGRAAASLPARGFFERDDVPGLAAYLGR
jgi:thiamine transport system ATP-binding protein